MSEFHQNKIAIVYDFDKTLSPKDMQEFGIFEHIGMKPQQFWDEVKAERDETKAEELLVYMRKMIHEAKKKDSNFTQEKLRSLGKEIEFFKGVLTWFDRVDAFIGTISGQENVQIEHYIISSGLRDMINGCEIAEKFKRIYACEFIYENGIPVWPARIVTDAAKTQYIFRINKGILNPVKGSINDHMPEMDRAVPFSNMMYIGDSDTDIPSMTVVMKNGGHSVAVFDPKKSDNVDHMEEMKRLKAAGRIDFFCPADYSKGSVLEKMVFQTLSVIANRILLRKNIFEL